MTTNLTVTVNGQPVPLDECGWLQRRPCGCIVAAVIAVVETVDDSGHVLATADQAHRHLNPTKRDRAKAARAGLTTELITMTHYREDIGSKWECEQHQKPAAAPVS
ncbi:hypothetical protein PV382_18040 [Streptomyces scabiei]|uniref:hypothetical protein n=1 Tax=Streptomyces scabiei TaxID=1930 RepID=UPI000765D0D5|nr:hypothetical protein [Streptomyces scabiei]MDX3174178.1 hypothetical protein [Streptomyces scabiei]